MFLVTGDVFGLDGHRVHVSRRRRPGAHRRSEPHRDIRVTQIYQGASDIQRLMIGRAVTAGQL
jgi:alkylation response protein AidB-like acyl-CoA dehydrogenase